MKECIATSLIKAATAVLIRKIKKVEKRREDGGRNGT